MVLSDVSYLDRTNVLSTCWYIVPDKIDINLFNCNTVFMTEQHCFGVHNSTIFVLDQVLMFIFK